MVCIMQHVLLLSIFMISNHILEALHFCIRGTPQSGVMENFNSVNGQGCDVHNAIPFYHWGALNALIPLLQTGKVPTVTAT